MTQAPPDADALLTGSRFAGRSLSFGELGAKPPLWHRNLRVAGRVITTQQTKVGTNEPLYFDDKGQKTTQVVPGAEVWQLIIPVWTDYRSDDIAEREGRDNGLRYLWVGGAKKPKPEGCSQRAALVQAMVRGRATSIHEAGALIAMGYVALGTPRPGQSPPRYYEAEYTRPEPGWTPPEEYIEPAVDELRHTAETTTGRAPVTNGQEAGIPLDDEPPW